MAPKAFKESHWITAAELDYLVLQNMHGAVTEIPSMELLDSITSVIKQNLPLSKYNHFKFLTLNDPPMTPIPA